jgi:hypothetical protein
VAPKPARLVFVFGMLLAVAVTTIMTWSHRNLAEPVPPTEAIYRAQHLNLY